MARIRPPLKSPGVCWSPIALVALGGFALLAVGVTHSDAVSAADAAIAATVQAFRSGWLDRVMVTITLLGDTVSLTLGAVIILGGLAWQRAWKPALVAIITFSATALLVTALKILVGRARPTVELYAGSEAFSFPSGHMTNSAVIFGMLAIVAADSVSGKGRAASIGGWLGLILLIGSSRVYLGAHWPGDVVAGGLLAIVVLAAARFAMGGPGAARIAPFAVAMIGLAIVAASASYAFVAFGAALSMYAPAGL